MRNPLTTALAALNGRKRGTASVVSVAAIGALALGTLGAGTAAAHGMVGSPDIENQSIRSWDVHRDAVGSSELRGAHDDRGPAVKSHQVKNGSLLHYDIKDGTIREKELNEKLRRKIGDRMGPKIDENDLGMDLRSKVNGVVGYEVDGFYEEVTANGQIATVTAECAPGKFALGGGYSTEFDRNLEHVEGVVASNFADFQPIEGDPQRSVRARAWEVRVRLDDSGKSFNIRPWVSCAQAHIPAG